MLMQCLRPHIKFTHAMLFNYCTHTVHVLQQASALPSAKIEVSSICDGERGASPASPISSEADTRVPSPHWLYPRG
jgi:5-hydroxyisourate hydrolase-like protein (transthyretin family)